jgi:ketosteroid isomerase-like protein
MKSLSGQARVGSIPCTSADRRILAVGVTEARSTDELIELIRQGVMFSGGTVLEGSEGIDQMMVVLRDNTHPDFVTVMLSESGMPQEYRGLEGFREALSDWISPYERFRLVIDEAIPLPDKIVFLARQVATTKHDGVEIETPSASVWWFEDGAIRQAGFYLDQRAGLQAAGLDPDRPRD